jgi:transcriptional repressor NrdR
MHCPFCHTDNTKVIDSRLLHEGFSVRRRRKCLSEKCEKRFTTYEQIEINMPMIVKSDGRREKFNKDKLRSGLTKACQKRPISTEQIERVLENIEKEIIDLSTKEVSSNDVGEILMQYLRNLDPVAYVRFASVYKNFQDVIEFIKDLEKQETYKEL